MHPYLQQRELVALAAAKGVIITAFSPLGAGGRPEVFRTADAPVLLEDPTVSAIAQDMGCSPAQVVLAWAIQRGTSVIPKSVNPGRMAENLAAAAIELSAEAMVKIDGLERALRLLPADFWAMEGSPYTAAGIFDE